MSKDGEKACIENTRCVTELRITLVSEEQAVVEQPANNVLF